MDGDLREGYTVTAVAGEVLLFLETQAVEGGRVNTGAFRPGEQAVAEQLAADGLVEFGQLPRDEWTRGSHCWVKLTDAGWTLAAVLRRERAARLWTERTGEEVSFGR